MFCEDDLLSQSRLNAIVLPILHHIFIKQMFRNLVFYRIGVLVLCRNFNAFLINIGSKYFNIYSFLGTCNTFIGYHRNSECFLARTTGTNPDF
ncbi:hypothetical protein D3C85_918160 [compost metagenome]